MIVAGLSFVAGVLVGLLLLRSKEYSEGYVQGVIDFLDYGVNDAEPTPKLSKVLEVVENVN